MTRAGERLYDLGTDPTPPGCQYVIGFVVASSLIWAAVPLLQWLYRLIVRLTAGS
jgi:hypothetical protein